MKADVKWAMRHIKGAYPEIPEAKMDADDKELEAMRELYRILKPFDRAAQERIAAYVVNRLAVEALQVQHEMWDAQQTKITAQQQLSAGMSSLPLNPIGRLDR